MQINLSDPNPPVKFYFDDDAPEKGHVLLKRMSPADAQKIRKQCTRKQPPEYRRGQRYEVPEKVNDDLMSEKMWDHIIVDWHGMTDQTGQEIPCTTEMKTTLMMRVPDFSAFVTKCLELLDVAPQSNGGEEDRLKNLSSTSQD